MLSRLMKTIYFFERIQDYHILSSVNHKNAHAFVELPGRGGYSKLKFKVDPYVVKSRIDASTRRTKLTVPVLNLNDSFVQVSMESYLEGKYDEELLIRENDRIKIMQWCREDRVNMRHRVYTSCGTALNNNHTNKYLHELFYEEQVAVR